MAFIPSTPATIYCLWMLSYCLLLTPSLVQADGLLCRWFGWGWGLGCSNAEGDVSTKEADFLLEASGPERVTIKRKKPIPAKREREEEDGLTVFVTSSSHTGNLGGLAGADSICQSLAVQAGLKGTFKAWLSDSTGASPETRFAHWGTAVKGGKDTKKKKKGKRKAYVLVDGTEIAKDWEELTQKSTKKKSEKNKPGVQHRIMLDEKGAIVPDGGDVYVWSSTNLDGTYTVGAPTCSDWTASNSGFGRSGHTMTGPPARTWTMGVRSGCNLSDRLYCFQQDDEMNDHKI